ncbi:MAG: hypothetical protein F6K19_32155 [Cyanothece sp. SIO1E1]|nr:hypothetical protein [Cyanothece sp. SIO1E1]
MLKLKYVLKTWLNQMLRTDRYLILRALGAGLGLSFLLAPSIAQTSPDSETPPTPPEIGWEFLGSQALNSASISEVQYEGECPDTDTSYREARFTSSETPPAPGRRVIIRNVTRGVASDPFPYTDREYEEGRSSEPTRMTFGAKHSRRRLHVLEGENEFEYEIKQGEQVLDSGSFTAEVWKELDVRLRNATERTKSVCANSSVPLSSCADIRTRSDYVCPGNKVIRTLIEPDHAEISTLISNQTQRTINYRLNGRRYRLFSGEDRMHEGDSLRVEFEPGCLRRRRPGGGSVCTPQPTEFSRLQPGKRYQFSLTYANRNLMELVDFPR